MRDEEDEKKEEETERWKEGARHRLGARARLTDCDCTTAKWITSLSGWATWRGASDGRKEDYAMTVARRDSIDG